MEAWNVAAVKHVQIFGKFSVLPTWDKSVNHAEMKDFRSIK